MLDSKKLIAEVKLRPAIYRYNDRNAKADAWTEVCAALVENWNELSSQERSIEEKNVRSKWRNIRDYFMKELRIFKKSTASRSGRARKKGYYNELLFLLPNVESQRTLSRNNKSKQTQRVKSEEPDDVIEMDGDPRQEFSLTGVTLEPSESEFYEEREVAVCQTTLTSFDKEIDVLSTTNGHPQQGTLDETDYDRMFLLSLLPSFRCIPEHAKLYVRIQIQQVIAAAFPSSNHRSD